MQNSKCDCCNAALPRKDTYSIQSRTLCRTCGESFLSQHPTSTVEVVQNTDPTVCTNCGADNGSAPHGTLLNVPTCANCTDFFRNRPFPLWVTLFFYSVTALVLVSLVWNWRFFQGYFEMRAAFAALAARDFNQADAEMTVASEHLSECKDVEEWAAFCRGLRFLEEDKCNDAESCFAKCGHMPPEFGIRTLQRQATIGAAFNRKDYDRFLELSEAAAKELPQDAMAQAQVASALACQYAVHGDPELRHRAEAKLDEAKALGNEVLEAGRYEERIRHRLETREIIKVEEYDRRFPKAPSTKESKS